MAQNQHFQSKILTLTSNNIVGYSRPSFVSELTWWMLGIDVFEVKIQLGNGQKRKLTFASDCHLTEALSTCHSHHIFPMKYGRKYFGSTMRRVTSNKLIIVPFNIT